MCRNVLCVYTGTEYDWMCLWSQGRVAQALWMCSLFRVLSLQSGEHKDRSWGITLDSGTLRPETASSEGHPRTGCVTLLLDPWPPSAASLLIRIPNEILLSLYYFLWSWSPWAHRSCPAQQPPSKAPLYGAVPLNPPPACALFGCQEARRRSIPGAGVAQAACYPHSPFVQWREEMQLHRL